MNILLDCTSLTPGGGLQVGLAIRHNAARTPQHRWHVALSAEMSAEVDNSLCGGFRSVNRLAPDSCSWHRVRQIRRWLPRIEEAIRPDLVFTIFGPLPACPRSSFWQWYQRAITQGQ